MHLTAIKKTCLSLNSEVFIYLFINNVYDKGQSTYLDQNFLFVHDPDHFSYVGTLLL